MAQDGVQTRGGGVARTIGIIHENQNRVVLRASHVEFCVNPSFLLGVLLWLVAYLSLSEAHLQAVCTKVAIATLSPMKYPPDAGLGGGGAEQDDS